MDEEDEEDDVVGNIDIGKKDKGDFSQQSPPPTNGVGGWSKLKQRQKKIPPDCWGPIW